MSRDMKPKRIFRIYKTSTGYFAFFEGNTEGYHERMTEVFSLEMLLQKLYEYNGRSFIRDYYLYESNIIMRDSTYLFSYDPKTSLELIIKKYPEYFI